MPPALSFSPYRDTASYYVTVAPAKLSRGRYDFGEIVWSDGYHRVRTPLVVRVTTMPDTDTGVDVDVAAARAMDTATATQLQDS